MGQKGWIAVLESGQKTGKMMQFWKVKCRNAPNHQIERFRRAWYGATCCNYESLGGHTRGWGGSSLHTGTIFLVLHQGVYVDGDLKIWDFLKVV